MGRLVCTKHLKQPRLLNSFTLATFPLRFPRQVLWRRIILDEAHCIKDRASNTAKAVFALQSKYRCAEGAGVWGRCNGLSRGRV